MERQLDEDRGKLLQIARRTRPEVRLSEQTQALVDGPNGRVGRCKFKDGDIIPADLVVMAVGIRPNTELAESAGISLQSRHSGQRHDADLRPAHLRHRRMRSHRGIAYGLVAPLFEQAKVCANHLAQLGFARYNGSVTSTKLKVTGIDLFSAGDFMGGEGTENITLSDPIGGVYKKLVIKDDKLVGACLYGDTADGAWYFRLLREGTQHRRHPRPPDVRRKRMGDVGHQGQNKACAWPTAPKSAAATACAKAPSSRRFRNTACSRVDDVKKHTKAASSCGSCTGLVEQILMNTVGSSFQETPKTKAVCACTDHNHGDVRKVIREQHLLTHREVYDFSDTLFSCTS